VYGGMVGIITNKLVTVPVLVIALLYASLGLTVFHKEREHVYGRDRLYVLVSSVGAFLATFILINIALYLSFTQVGINHVEGLQGRYFLALFPLIGIILHTALPRLFVKVPDVLVNALAYPAIATGLIATFLAIH
ncbi:MAG TPA: DUF2142 domain-containing protein, partial [Patescibacteria group bacterium]|nr:DUF2142 domain-containing protein [Patescibacteria group bacterium]